MIKTFSILCLAGLSFMGCKNAPKTTPQGQAVVDEPTPAPVKKMEDMLVGKIERKQLTEGDYGTWFNANFDNYTVDEALATELKNLLKDVKITTFMGTWCGDSKREVPRFYKIMDAVGKSEKDITLIAMERSKTTPSKLEEGMNITNVPTFIFMKNGKELGRIVESTRESLEQDMIKILKDEDYKHIYED